MADDESPYLNVKRLAAKLGRGHMYVHAMKRAGYRFEYDAVTTLPHAQRWLKEHPEFRVNNYATRQKAAATIAAQAQSLEAGVS